MKKAATARDAGAARGSGEQPTILDNRSVAFPNAHRQRPDTQANQSRLWAEFCRARSRAMGTRDLARGIEAGKAWAAFLAAFLEPERVVQR